MASDTRVADFGLVSPLQGLSISKATSFTPLPLLPVNPDNTLDEGTEEEEEEDDLDTRSDTSQSNARGYGGASGTKHDFEQERAGPTQQLPLNNAFVSASPASRPHNLRRATDPITPIANNLNPPLHLRPAAPVMGRSRNRSPYSRSHLRSRSSNSSLGYPMTRAYSSPLADTLTPLPEMHPLPTQQLQQARPASPMDSQHARRASPRRSLEEPFMFSQVEVGTPSVPTIEEYAELSLPSPTPTIPEDSIMPASPQPVHSTFPRSRRRPSSPLYSFAQPTRIGSPGHRVLHTSTSTPMLSQSSSQSSTNLNPSVPAGSPASRYNETFPAAQTPTTATAALSSASSMYSLSMSSSAYSGSMPSTPTSIRSRSPSVSSLGTIPDSPDAEEEAMERERIDAHERLERLEKLNKIVGNRDGEELGRRSLGAGKERKRWSVCGAERRGDLEMETIWED